MEYRKCRHKWQFTFQCIFLYQKCTFILNWKNVQFHWHKMKFSIHENKFNGDFSINLGINKIVILFWGFNFIFSISDLKRDKNRNKFSQSCPYIINRQKIIIFPGTVFLCSKNWQMEYKKYLWIAKSQVATSFYLMPRFPQSIVFLKSFPSLLQPR